uniref:Slc28a-3 n=1 Tax=Schmidtea mediterranea TaxID=79327 RepID=A0A0H3YKD8_SCHMD|nr:slc28a-3 [Schmidtea mediterranea]
MQNGENENYSKQNPNIMQLGSLKLDSSMNTIKLDFQQNRNEKTELDCDSPEKLYVESDFEPLPEKTNFLSIHLGKIFETFSRFFLTNQQSIQWISAFIILIFYTVFFIWSIKCNFIKRTLFIVEDNIRLIWISSILYAVVIYKVIMEICKYKQVKFSNNILKNCASNEFYKKLQWTIYGLLWVLIGIYVLYIAIVYNLYNLVSLSGIIILILISFCLSTAPHMINWKPVITGILLQFLLALLILTTSFGYEIFRFLGERVTEFLNHTEAGCIMVFGQDFAKHFVAFRILPIIVFLSSIISVLYYLGVIQLLVISLGIIMQKLMGTTCGESLNAAGNIFLGMCESPLLIRPLIGRMTNSELHAVMTGGFATIAGSVLGAYIGFGAPANHLISASVMSAPAALAISKLMYPETKKSKNTKKDIRNLPKSPYKNIVEATTAGASESIPLVANIAVNLIAFVAILAFLNSILAWLGERACMSKKLSFELLCSFFFWPLSLFMGVHIGDCRKVAELIGVKTFLNEFIAFQKLGILLSNRKILDSVNQTFAKVAYGYDDVFIHYNNGTNVTLHGGIIQQNRSVVIATYALCGFANFGSVGILLSSLGTMIPHRRSDLSKMIIRAMIAGNIACFLTACIAGLFYKE